MSYIICAIVGYLAGSCPTGFLAVKYVRGADIRAYGSGNIGATNVGRLMGKKWAVAVAVFDMLKGGAAVLAVSLFTPRPELLALTGVCAVLGHNYPVWLGFKGGKGVATTFGVVAFYDFFNPWPAVLGGVAWYAVMRFTKYVSAASIAGLFAASFCASAFGMARPYFLASLFLACLSLWRHRSNIRRLMDGTESKVKR